MASVLVIVWLHFFADFLLQNDRMAIKKSSSNRWLTIHLCAYTWPFAIMFGWKYALINGAAHWVTDWVSSRATTKLWKADKRHWFFVVIGLDQAIHMTCLLATLPLAIPIWTLGGPWN